MLFISEYRFKPFADKEEVTRLMTLFGQRGDEPGTIANYVRLDGSGGFVIVEQDDPAKAYEGVLAYGEFMEWTVTPVMKVEDAVPVIGNYLS
jgi:uncharacterized protein DUF3303